MQCRKPYAEECKQEAVKLVTKQDMSATQVARDLGISLDTLHRWLRAARSVATPTDQEVTPTAERVQLRREHEQLRMEREIRKKALGIFSRMPQCAIHTRSWPARRATPRSSFSAGCWGWPVVATMPGKDVNRVRTHKTMQR